MSKNELVLMVFFTRLTIRIREKMLPVVFLGISYSKSYHFVYRTATKELIRRLNLIGVSQGIHFRLSPQLIKPVATSSV